MRLNDSKEESKTNQIYFHQPIKQKVGDEEQVPIDFYQGHSKSRNVISAGDSEKRSATNVCDTMDLDQVSVSQNVNFTDLPITNLMNYKLNEEPPLS
jgi:predicted DNA-binding protein